MDKQKLARILGNHAKYLNGDEGGERADLRGANLYGATLRGANLRGADVSHNNFILSASLSNYSIYFYRDKHGVRFTAGCRRSMTIEEAREHWSEKNRLRWSTQTIEYGKRQLAMVEFLIAQARILGWPVDNTDGEES